MQPPVGATSEISWARLGVWHILPASVSENIRSEGRVLSEDEIENLLDVDSHSILIYFHGNSFDRTTTHRCNLYNFLSDMGFHVLAIDYRGLFSVKVLKL